MNVQQVEQRPVKKRRFFVEDSETSTCQKRNSPGTEFSTKTEVSKKAADLATGVIDHNHDDNVNGHTHDFVRDSNIQDLLDPNAFRAVVGEDVTEDVIETIREMSGNSLTRGQS